MDQAMALAGTLSRDPVDFAVCDYGRGGMAARRSCHSFQPRVDLMRRN